MTGIYYGSTPIDTISYGNVNVVEVYYGSTLIWQQWRGTLNSATDVNLETWLTGQSAPVGSAITVNIPVGETIGATGTGTAALTTGDLSSWTKGVTLNVNGEIQGAGGAAGANGGNAIDVTDSSSITIVNNGAIRAGGAGGGTGGAGGLGDDVYSWGAYQYATSSPRYYWHLSDAMEIYYAGVNYGPSGSTWSYKRSGSYMYNRGDKVTLTYYKIRRGTYYAGTAGTGGAGGVGKGYGQDNTDGTAGTAGTYRSGNGGAGGNGGSWGEDGNAGSTGASGLYYSNYSSSAVRSGSSGSVGGVAGNAIDSGTGTVYLTDNGVINGDVI